VSKFKAPEKKELEMVQQAFAELELVDEMINATQQSDAGRIMASDLHAYACGDASQAVRIKSALLLFPAMRGVLKNTMRGAAIYHMPEAIAASTEEIPTRRTDGCALRVEVSRAEPDLYYLIIELDDGRSVPSVLTVCDVNDQYEQIELPAPRRGVIQVAIAAESGIPNMLHDPKSAVYLH
jgi:hypothetical protein